MSDPAPLPLTGPERLFVRAFIPIAAVSWTGIALAEVSAFTPARVLALAGPLTLGAWWLSARDLVGARVGDALRRAAHLGLGAALLLGALLFARPGEYLIEGADASVYLAIGRSIERTGGLAPPDRLVTGPSPATRDALLAADTAWPHALSRFPGGIHVGPNQPRLTFEFFHLLPVWIAAFAALAGPRGAYFVNVAFALLAVWTTWLIGRRAWSAGAGTIAAVLLASSFGEIWYARIAASEMLAQWLLLAAALFTLLSRDAPSRTVAACAGVAVGLAGFTRIDALLLLVPLASAWLILARRRNLLPGAWWWYTASLAIAGGHALLHAVTLSAPYTMRLAHDAWVAAAAVVSPRWPLLLAGAAAATAAAAGVLRLLPARARLPVVALVMVLGPAALSPNVTANASQLFTRAGVVAMVVGFGLIVVGDARVRLLPLTAPFACEAVLWLAWHEKTIWPDDFRRLVPAVLPLGTLFIAGLTVRLGRLGARWRRSVWLLPAGLGAAWLVQARPVLVAPPMQCVHAQLEALAGRMPEDAIVLTDASLPGHVSLALQSTFGRDGVRVVPRVPPETLRRFIDSAAAGGRRVVVALGGYTVDLPRRFWRSDFEGLHVAPAGVGPLVITTLARSADAFPAVVRTSNLEVELYEVGSTRPPAAATPPVVVDLGARDFAYAVGGFHPPEWMVTTFARWTSGQGRIFIPRVMPPPGGAMAIVVRLAAYRPPNVSTPKVHLTLDGLDVGDITGAAPTFTEYRFPVGPSVLARLTDGDSILVMRSDTFVPSQTGASADGRVLGVAVDWVRLEAGSPEP